MNLSRTRPNDQSGGGTVPVRTRWANRSCGGKRIICLWEASLSIIILFGFFCIGGCPEVKLGGDWTPFLPKNQAQGLVVRYGVAMTIPASTIMSEYDLDQCQDPNAIQYFNPSTGEFVGFKLTKDPSGPARCLWVVADICSSSGGTTKDEMVYAAAAASVAQSMGVPEKDYTSPQFQSLVLSKINDWKQKADVAEADLYDHFQLVNCTMKPEYCGTSTTPMPYLVRTIGWNTGDEYFGLATVDPTQSTAHVFLYLPGQDTLQAKTNLAGTIGGLKRNCKVDEWGVERCEFILTHALIEVGSFSLGSEVISNLIVRSVGLNEGNTRDNWVYLNDLSTGIQFTDSEGTWITTGTSGAALSLLSWDPVAGKVSFSFPQTIELEGGARVVIVADGSATFLNRSPVAVIPELKAECEGDKQASVLLDGSQSFDPDNNLAFAAWREGTVADPLRLLGQGLTFTMTAPLGSTPVFLELIDGWSITEVKETRVTVVDTTPPSLTCPELQVIECTEPAGAVASYSPIVSDICSKDLALNCTPTSGSIFPIGTTSVYCQALDPKGNESLCSSHVTVVDTTPPVISSVTPSLNVLWPPKHKMVPVNVNVLSSDNCDPKQFCRITSVSSNEPVNGLGDGDSFPDWEIIGDLKVNLRAERSGTGRGRVYTITVTCRDASGNSTVGATNVTVPHVQEARTRNSE